MAGRRSLLVAIAVALSVLLVAACTVAGALVESAGLSKNLGDHGYANVGVNVGFNTSNGIRTDTLTVTVDRPSAAPSDDAAASAVATFVIDTYSRISDVETLVVVLNADQNAQQRTFTRSPQQWRDHVIAMSLPPGIADAVIAHGTFGEMYEPRDITSDFAADQSEFHAVVSIRKLPPGSLVRAAWVAVDTHGDSSQNVVLNATEARVEGTRNIDFALKPTQGYLPRGRYKVDIYLDAHLDRSLPFTVAGG
jgi:hypothetical protein